VRREMLWVRGGGEELLVYVIQIEFVEENV
jgi:hypothetical protein